jgi:hypothetical protein
MGEGKMRSAVKSQLKFQISVACIGLALAFSANAQSTLVHYYDFSTGTANDQVGTANGTLTGTATITGGGLYVNGGNGTVGGQFGGGGPMLVLDPSAGAGITGAFTIEDWFTCTTGWPKNDTLWCFTDASTTGNAGGSNPNYLFNVPVQADYNYWASAAFVVGGGGLTRSNVGWDLELKGNQSTGVWLDQGGPHQTILTYDGNTFTYYVDGAIAWQAPTVNDPGFNLSSLPEIAIGGGSPYNDPAMTGDTWSFAIMSGAISSNQVASLYGLGSAANSSDVETLLVPEPGTLALVGLGVAPLIWCWRRKNYRG